MRNVAHERGYRVEPDSARGAADGDDLFRPERLSAAHVQKCPNGAALADFEARR
jgi:hypothetical protein